MSKLKNDNLLSRFFSECENCFAFLKQKHDFEELTGLAFFEHGRQIIKPYYVGDAPAETFWAISRYEKDGLAIELSYGDKSFILEGHIYYQHMQRVGFEEVLQMAKKDDTDVRSRPWLTSEHHVAEAITDIAQSIKKNKPYFLKYNEKFVERTMVMRAQRLQQAIRDQHKQNIKYISLMSAQAFQEKNYKRVIQLLRPYQQYLEPGELKKLDLATQKFLKTKIA